MLIIAKSLGELNFGQLMAVYEEGNRENGAERWPKLPEGQQLRMAEADFYQYLREVFFPVTGSVYCIWEEHGQYVSALRLEPYRDGLLLEGVETVTDQRRRGYGGQLVRAVLAQWTGTKLYSHVSKRNIPSLRLHESCGFRKLLDYAVYVDGSVSQRCWTFVSE